MANMREEEGSQTDYTALMEQVPTAAGNRRRSCCQSRFRRDSDSFRVSQAIGRGSNGLIEEESSVGPAEPESRSCGHTAIKTGLCRHPFCNQPPGNSGRWLVDSTHESGYRAELTSECLGGDDSVCL